MFIPVLANALPEAGAWMLGFMAACALLMWPAVVLLQRRRRVREGRELHTRIAEAEADILKDGVVSGPKGPYVPHRRWDVGSEVGTPRDGSLRESAYHGMPWPR